MIFKICDHFDLDKTLDCGQCFRWVKKSNYWSGVVNGYLSNVYFENQHLKIESDLNSLTFWKNYFDLDFDYSKPIKQFLNYGYPLSTATRENSGIHILNQDPWEVLCSFIISQNNNIPRIKSIIERLCRCYGTCHDKYYSFPSPKIISSLNISELSAIKAGFRAKYILDAAKCVSDLKVDLDSIHSMESCDALRYLQSINGVGPKVSSCVLLYGFHRTDCFPIDTWIKKVLHKFPDFNFDLLPHKGLAQIYLFSWIRSHPEYLE